MKSILAFLLPLIFTFSVGAKEDLKVVENEKVCMVTDMYFAKKQIPVTVESKTYYGCCENCKATLSNDAKARISVDPVSKKPVDKATAVIATRSDNSVIYFENKKNLEKYQRSN